jgi:hypothetical protein
MVPTNIGLADVQEGGKELIGIFTVALLYFISMWRQLYTSMGLYFYEL